jgi:plasmid segregation protein ParM
VDVGYRYTKFVVGAEGTQIQCRSFPSVAPVAAARELSEALGRKRQTVVMEVDGLRYEVGPDARLAQEAFRSQNMDDDFAATPEYIALVRGALYYMKVDEIDILVVGLPVSTFALRKSILEKRLVGEHPVDEGKTVEVKKVRVLAQPHGALMNYALAGARLAAVKRERNLIIDCGARTFDWLVSQGLKTLEKRSHAVNRGMHDVLLALADEIGREFRIQYSDYDRLDRALRTRAKPLIFGREYDISKHLPAARKVVTEAVTEMRRYVQDGSDLDNIIVAGGAAFFFREAIGEALSRHHIQELPDGFYANVQGFQLAGMELANQEERRYRSARAEISANASTASTS